MPLIAGLLCLWVLSVLSAALGRRLLLWLGVDGRDVWERGVLAAGLGLGAWQAVPFALFTLGLGRPLWFRLTMAILSVLLARDVAAVVRSGWLTVRGLPRPCRANIWLWVTAGLLTLALVNIFLRAVCPVLAGDGLAYHLPAALKMLRAERWVYLPTLTYSNWPLSTEMLFALLSGVWAEAPASVVAFWAGAVSVGAAMVLARRLAGPGAGAIAGCLMLLLTDLWSQMATPMVDGAFTAFATLSALALTIAAQQTDGSPGDNAGAAFTLRWLRVSALFAGLAATTKLTGLWIVVCGAAILLLWQRRFGRGNAVRKAFLYALWGCLVVAPWFIKTWAVTGNPFYPLAYSWFGGREWTADGWPRFRLALLAFNTPAGAAPTPDVLEHAHRLYALTGAAVCLVFLGLVARTRTAIPLVLVPLFAACICVSAYISSRFLLPVAPIALCCLAAGLSRWARVALPLACLTGIVFVQGMLTHRLKGWLPTPEYTLKYLTGQISASRFQDAYIPEYAVSAWANRRVPVHARLLLNGGCLCVGLYHVDALWSTYNLQDSFHYDTPEHLERDLRRLHVGYLVLSPFPADCARNASCRQQQETERGPLEALARRRGTLLYAAHGSRLYQLRDETLSIGRP